MAAYFDLVTGAHEVCAPAQWIVRKLPVIVVNAAT